MRDDPPILNPCPFCGEQAHIKIREMQKWAGCENANCPAGVIATSITTWNHREETHPSPDRDGLIEKLEAVAFDDMVAAEDRPILKLEEAIAIIHRFFNGRPAVPGKALEMMTRDELLAHVRGLVEKLAAAAFRASDISTALYIPLQKAIAIIKGEIA